VAPQRIIPFIGYEDAAAAIDWLTKAFGFRESGERFTDENGVVTHAELELEGATIFLSTPPGYASPRTVRAESEAARRAHDNPWVIDGLFVEVDDVDTHHDHALAAGANVIRGLDEPGIGQRIYSAEDLEGHRWMFGQQL
jgi:uncharacterized glyoxalase superfamily protein PhnB